MGNKGPFSLPGNDGIRPDGLTFIVWRSSSNLNWNVIVSDTVAALFRIGGIQENMKYNPHLSNDFVPLAFEKSGPC